MWNKLRYIKLYVQLSIYMKLKRGFSKAIGTASCAMFI